MHVLHIFNEIKYSGAEIMYANAAGLFQKEGIKMTAVSTAKNIGDFSPHFDKAGIAIVHKPFPHGNRNPFFAIRYFRDIYSFLKKEKVDVIHIHRSDIFWLYSLCARMAGKKTIVTQHNVFKNKNFTLPKARIERLTARKFLNVTFQSIGQSVYNNELEYYKTPSTIVNNWYDEKKFYPAENINEKIGKRKELGINPTDFVVISVGGCSEIKNHTDIIKSLAQVVDKAPCVYLHLGTGHSEKEEKEESCLLKVNQHIHFVGNRANVRDYLIASDVFIMPSKYEGLGNAAVEAMGCKVPCILYNCPGLVELIHNDDNGFLIESSYSAIAEKILLMANNPSLVAEKGNNAYNFAKTNFNMEKSVEQIIGLYRKN